MWKNTYWEKAVILPLLISALFLAGPGVFPAARTFVDPADRIVPAPIFPGAVYDPKLSGILARVFQVINEDKPERVMAFVVYDDMIAVGEFYEKELSLTFHPFEVNVKTFVDRLGEERRSLGIQPTNGIMKGRVDGGFLIFQPYYDFARSTWREETLLIISQ